MRVEGSVAVGVDDLPERYRGKPILILIENYALDVIGQLPADKRDSLVMIAKRVWGGGTDWKATLRRQLAWDPSINAEILMNWRNFTDAARKQGIPADPNAFARAFGDEMDQP